MAFLLYIFEGINQSGAIMKYVFFLSFFLFSLLCEAQRRLPIVKATNSITTFYEQGQATRKWNLRAGRKSYTHITNKFKKSILLALKTDIDSISIKLKPGKIERFYFVNGPDSCLITLQGPAPRDYRYQKPEIHDTVAYTLNRFNTANVKTIINTTDTLNLNFDTGATELTVTEDALQHKVKGRISLYDEPNTARIGRRDYQTNIYDSKMAGHEADGLFGWNLFDGMVVELNYDKNIMVVHSRLPKWVGHMKNVAKLKIRYFNYRFLVESELKQNGTAVKDWFLFDTGYQNTVMLDNDLLARQRFPADKMEVIDKVVMHGTNGNDIPVLTSCLQLLRIGNFELEDIPAQVMTTNKTRFGSNIHILGHDVIKRFNIVLDFQDDVVYLVPNGLYNAAYIGKT